MKSSNSADAQSASTHYAPSVPMTVYRELAAELRANQAVIDSLNSRNQQLLEQNQRLKQEIHNVVQATLSLGQVAGVARQAPQGDENLQGFSRDFLGAVAPDTLARLVRGGEAQSAAQSAAQSDSEAPLEQPMQSVISRQVPPQASQSPSAVPATPRNRVPRAIASRLAKQPAKQPTSPAVQAAARNTAQNTVKNTIRDTSRNAMRQQAQKQPRQPAFRQTEAIPSKGSMTQLPNKKLFTEQSGEYRSAVLDASESKEIGGIWLVLSIILIIVTAFGAGFLIMKPLLNDR